MAIIVTSLRAAQVADRSVVNPGWYLPLVAFAVLAWLERRWPCCAGTESRADHLLNLIGLAIQGIAIPAAGYLIATRVLAVHWPDSAGCLQIGWWGAFILNFVAIDLLYYAQHRVFHRVDGLWALHQCHHAAPTVNVWTTSRNSLLINLLFVYMLANPVLGFMCDRPEGFFFAAALTASLDLWRHSRLPERFTPAWIGWLFVTPAHHHLHHSPSGQRANFGANLMLWDRLYGTGRDPQGYPARYGTLHAPTPWRQFLYPWKSAR